MKVTRRFTLGRYFQPLLKRWKLDGLWILIRLIKHVNNLNHYIFNSATLDSAMSSLIKSIDRFYRSI